MDLRSSSMNGRRFLGSLWFLPCCGTHVASFDQRYVSRTFGRSTKAGGLCVARTRGILYRCSESESWAVGTPDVLEAAVGAQGEITLGWDDGWADDGAEGASQAGGALEGKGADDPDEEVVSSGLGSPRGGRVWRAEGVSRHTEGPVKESVVDRGLVTGETSAASILQEHLSWDAAESLKRFSGESLGYVTPWHGRGYDFARTFRSKFTYICPVWYQLRGEEVKEGDEMSASPGEEGAGFVRKKFTLLGGHDFDRDWVSDVRDGVGAEDTTGAGARVGGTTKIVPRVVLEMRGRFSLSGNDLLEMAELLVEEAILRRYHGFVLDVPLSDGIEQFLFAIKHVGAQRGFELLLIQTIRAGTQLSERQLEQLEPLVDRFSLMTYDYGVAGGGVPISPLQWVRESVEALAPKGDGDDIRRKVLMGLPFYGYDQRRAINYDEIIALLRRDEEDEDLGGLGVQIQWDDLTREHVISYRRDGSANHIATYATLKFIEERITLARELGVGIAVWELGQGMPYFFDLL